MRIDLMAMVASLALFCGCAQQGGGCSDPYVKVGNICCVDGDANGICDKDETPTTTRWETTTTSRPTTTTPTSTAPPATKTPQTSPETTTTTQGITTTTLKACRSPADCGYAYIGGCTCGGGGVTKTVYKPVCDSGRCKWKGEAQIDRCRDGSGSGEKERCVPGYARCIPESEYKEYFVTPEDAEILKNLAYGDYATEYEGYKFRVNSVQLPEDSVCFDDALILIDVKTPRGKEKTIEIEWDKWADIDNLEIGLKDIRKTENGTLMPRIWVRET